MPNVEEKLQALLATKCSAYPTEAPYGTAMPFLTWQQVGGEPIVYVNGKMPNYMRMLVQINLWAVSDKEASRLIREIEEMLCDSDLCATPDSGAVSEIDEGRMNMRGRRQSFSIWGSRT